MYFYGIKLPNLWYFPWQPQETNIVGREGDGMNVKELTPAIARSKEGKIKVTNITSNL